MNKFIEQRLERSKKTLENQKGDLSEKKFIDGGSWIRNIPRIVSDALCT
jgi:hypothetical protein